MIVIGDVHGCYKTLISLINKLPHNRLIFVGDLIDRGPQSKDVINYVIDNNHMCVMGNHEEMFTNGNSWLVWMRNGGNKTISSYSKNGNVQDDVISSHRHWSTKLPLYIEYKNFIISHSMILNCWDIDHTSLQFKRSVLWDRDIDRNTLPEGIINIFGHTPVKNVIKEKNYINIDGGCYYKEIYGKLFAYDMDTDIIYEQNNIED